MPDVYTVKLFNLSTDEQIGNEKCFNTRQQAWDYALDMADDNTYASIQTPDGDEYII